MKRKLQILALAVFLSMTMVFSVNVSAKKTADKAESEDAVLTVKNSTVFPLKDIVVIYNHDQELEVEGIPAGETELVDIPKTDRDITEVKISGKFFNGKTFSGTFSGLINNDTLLTVDLDEDFSVFVSSNLDTL